MQFGLQQVHGLDEGLLLTRGELVEDAGERASRAVEPLVDQGGLSADDRGDGAPPVGRVGAALDESRAVQIGEHAADGGQGDTKIKKRDDHLRSADFFDAANYPDITFSVEAISPAADGVTVVGGLTVRGTTRPVSFGAAVSVNDGEVTLDAEIPVNRADYDLTFNQLGMMGMKSTITIHAVFTRQ